MFFYCVYAPLLLYSGIYSYNTVLVLYIINIRLLLFFHRINFYVCEYFLLFHPSTITTVVLATNSYIGNIILLYYSVPRRLHTIESSTIGSKYTSIYYINWKRWKSIYEKYIPNNNNGLRWNFIFIFPPEKRWNLHCRFCKYSRWSVLFLYFLMQYFFGISQKRCIQYLNIYIVLGMFSEKNNYCMMICKFISIKLFFGTFRIYSEQVNWWRLQHLKWFSEYVSTILIVFKYIVYSLTFRDLRMIIYYIVFGIQIYGKTN